MPTTRPQRRSDYEVQQAVEEELDWSPEIDSAHIGVAVHDGTVTLSGEVDSFAERMAAMRAAFRVKGVSTVQDDIDVRGDHGRSRPAADDILRAVDTALGSTEGLPDTIRAEVREHTVVLTGEVDWDFQRRLARRIVANLRGVTHVDSRIELTRRPSAPDTEERIRRALVRNALLDGSTIDVSVLGNTVTLAGRVRSWTEREQAERVAWSSPHVTAVRNLIAVRSVG